MKGWGKARKPQRMAVGGSVDGPNPSNASNMSSGYGGSANGGLGNSSREGGFGGSASGGSSRQGDSREAGMMAGSAGRDGGGGVGGQPFGAQRSNTAAKSDFNPHGIDRSLKGDIQKVDPVLQTARIRVERMLRTPNPAASRFANIAPEYYARAIPQTVNTAAKGDLNGQTVNTAAKGDLGTIGTSVGRMPSYVDQASVVPGSVSFTQQTKTSPFSGSPQEKALLGYAGQPMTKAQALSMQSRFPSGTALIGRGLASLAYPQPKGFTASSYNSYPTTIDGYNFSVNVPKSATISSPGAKVGSFNPAPASPSTPREVASIRDGGFGGASSGSGAINPAASVSVAGGTQRPSAPPGVVSPSRMGFASSMDGMFRNGRERDDDRRNRVRKKKPVVIETAKDGGLMRGDGKSKLKTKGKMI